MDIVVKGRNVEVPADYRQYVAEKLDKAVRLDRKIIEVVVELRRERNPRQRDHSERVEITCVSRGPVVRAEAAARDFATALDEAVGRLRTRLRRAADRRRVHRRRRAPRSVAAATADLPTDLPTDVATELGPEARTVRPDGSRQDRPEPAEPWPGSPEDDDQPWHLVREKEHPGDPVTVEDALFQMELLGHDFYLFRDKESGRPSVVYRRRAFDYGVISLAASGRSGA